jgi:Tetratricopeptide repeat
MITVILVLAIMLGAGWMVWRHRRRGRTPAVSGIAAGMSPERLAFEAFTHGNTCLAAGQFAEAIAAFQRARELDPKRPHVAERLAEVARRQHAAHASREGTPHERHCRGKATAPAARSHPEWPWLRDQAGGLEAWPPRA